MKGAPQTPYTSSVGPTDGIYQVLIVDEIVGIPYAWPTERAAWRYEFDPQLVSCLNAELPRKFGCESRCQCRRRIAMKLCFQIAGLPLFCFGSPGHKKD